VVIAGQQGRSASAGQFTEQADLISSAVSVVSLIEPLPNTLIFLKAVIGQPDARIMPMSVHAAVTAPVIEE
jgi:hypothetical protein